ncbi:hypothetical protein GCM10023116_01760 [Kistimonas scapharcae]|uniref:Uncharacterized protein n=1 Tax=Kistimonas scapharcae TaxID=1036133 RepID=A0ABP8UX55_9GAMM
MTEKITTRQSNKEVSHDYEMVDLDQPTQNSGGEIDPFLEMITTPEDAKIYHLTKTFQDALDRILTIFMVINQFVLGLIAVAFIMDKVYVGLGWKEPSERTITPETIKVFLYSVVAQVATMAFAMGRGILKLLKT